jgi:hypothetical protein
VSTPVYFLAGVSVAQLFPADVLDRSVLAGHGLAETWRDVDPRRGVDWYHGELSRATGPGKQPGVLISALPVESREIPRSLEYQPDDTTWQWTEIEPGKTWIGIDRTQPVRPDDVARRQQQQGYFIKLDDGQRWLLPVIRRPEWTDTNVAGLDGSPDQVRREFGPGVPQLDQAITVDWRERIVRKSVRPCDQRIWDWSEKFYRMLYRDTELDAADVPDEFEQCAFCAELLGMNYRLGGEELNRLGLLGELSRNLIIGCALAFPWYTENRAVYQSQKKS